VETIASDSAFSQLTDAEAAQVLTTLSKYAKAARGDPAIFAEYAFHTEAQQPIVLAPHQRLLLRFVMLNAMCVIRMPVGASKTFLMTVLGLWLIGKDVTSRGAVISSGSRQAEKPLAMMMQYIEDVPQVQHVFPHLMKSSDPTAVWRQTGFTIERPIGIRDPSMAAYGLKGKLPGARLSWALVDDVLDAENTHTKEQRAMVATRFHSTIARRLDTSGARLVVTNTPWDRDDLTYQLEALDWPTISMSVEGFITISNLKHEEVLRDYGDLIRPSLTREGKWRLRAHDPDASESTLLWPERWSRAWYQTTKASTPPHEFARAYQCEPMAAGAARCLREWVDQSYKGGAGFVFPCKASDGSWRYTGVDIGGVKTSDDQSSICTIELRPDKKRRILNLQSGRWNGPELIQRIVTEAHRYDSDVYVESNASQKFIADFAIDFDKVTVGTRGGIRVHKFNTGKNKWDPQFGVEAVFTEMMQGLWEWPNQGRPHEELKELADECVFYDPEQHTGDRLMALFLARQGLARLGRGDGAGTGSKRASAIKGGGF
jgi:hypothetical protein